LPKISRNRAARCVRLEHGDEGGGHDQLVAEGVEEQPEFAGLAQAAGQIAVQEVGEDDHDRDREQGDEGGRIPQEKQIGRDGGEATQQGENVGNEDEILGSDAHGPSCGKNCISRIVREGDTVKHAAGGLGKKKQGGWIGHLAVKKPVNTRRDEGREPAAVPYQYRQRIRENFNGEKGKKPNFTGAGGSIFPVYKQQTISCGVGAGWLFSGVSGG
jgi:hypothetical protein